MYAGYSYRMAQKPVANALTLELEPVVEANMDATSPPRNSGSPTITCRSTAVRTSPSSAGATGILPRRRCPGLITDACEILLLLKDNLAGHHRELVEHFILEDWWGRWLGRWTAEEHLHAIALREYLVVTREVDPTANEEARVQYVMKGYRADTYSQVETLVYMAFSERSYAVFCRNLAAQIEEPILAGLIDRIARDEARHEEFFANLVAHCLEYTRDETIAAIAARAADLAGRRCRHRRLSETRCRTSPRRAFSTPHSCARRSPTASPHGVWPTSPQLKQFVGRLTERRPRRTFRCSRLGSRGWSRRACPAAERPRE